MQLIDLTHSTMRKTSAGEVIPVVVRSAAAIHRVPLDRLVTLATVIDARNRPDPALVTRSDLAGMGLSMIGGCIIRTDWLDGYLSGLRSPAPALAVEAAGCLLESGVRTVASDFPITDSAADMLLMNDCIIVHCLSNLSALSEEIVRLIALPLKLEDTFSADARVIAMEE